MKGARLREGTHVDEAEGKNTTNAKTCFKKRQHHIRAASVLIR
jgi:hypothetical protein